MYQGGAGSGETVMRGLCVLREPSWRLGASQTWSGVDDCRVTGEGECVSACKGVCAKRKVVRRAPALYLGRAL